jgi:hypothetical protein
VADEVTGKEGAGMGEGAPSGLKQDRVSGLLPGRTGVTGTAEGRSDREWSEPPAAQLIVVEHPTVALVGRAFALRAGTVMEVGRSTECEMSFPGLASLSRRHARLHYIGRQILLEDLNSTNGTWLGNERVSSIRPLVDGDRFRVAGVQVELVLDGAPEAW